MFDMSNLLTPLQTVHAAGETMLTSVATHAGVVRDLSAAGAAPHEIHRRIPEISERFGGESPTLDDGGEENQQLQCLNGSYTRGSWEGRQDAEREDGLRSIYAMEGPVGESERHFRLEFPNEVQPPASYEWVPEDCELLPFSPEGMCGALDGRSILFVGDSTTFEMFQSFVAQMYKEDKGGHFGQLDPSSCGPVEICPADERTGRGEAKVAYIRNDHLTVQNQTSEEESRAKQAKAACFPYGDYCFSWIPRLVDFEIVVLNTGAHTVERLSSRRSEPKESLRRARSESLGKLRSYEEITRTAVTALAEIGYDGGVIYRTSTPGHTHCANASGPLSLEDESALKAFEKYSDSHYRRFHWAQIVEANEIARRTWSEAGATILDGAPILRMRPDGHRKANDCLHYSLPGPPDLWALLLYNSLSGRIA